MIDLSIIEDMKCFVASDYRNNYPDLKDFNSQQLLNHFCKYGLVEGRYGRDIALRENLIKGLDSELSCLEIGPFLNPVTRGKNVKYFDVLDKNGLIERANRIGYEGQLVENIDYVSEFGDLSVVTENFDIVISAHCIEHQPDLIKHLVQVESILKTDGTYFLIVPDKRYCFDSLIAESTIAEVIQAHKDARSVHLLRSVIEHRALTTHNSALDHWQGNHGKSPPSEALAERILAALDEFDAANGSYVDVHAWQFTPFSFFGLMKMLKTMRFISLEVKFVCNTAYGRNEFVAALTKNVLL
jgi:SAM-dependent methyltransferase